MAAPTQDFPPWLSVSTSVFTDAVGGVSTSTTLLHLPLTYFGPSIPLGTDGAWTFGGSVSPTSAPSATSSAIPSTITQPPSTAIPSTSSAIPSSSSSSLLSSSSFTSLSAQSTSSSSSFSTVPTASSASVKHRNVLIGSIIGSVLGSLLLFLLFLLLVRWHVRRRKYQTPIWTGWEVVHEGEAQETHDAPREPGEGSPRGSGEEADSFLRASGSGSEGMRQTSDRMISIPTPAVSGDAHSDSSSTTSGYGTVIERPRITLEEPSTTNSSPYQGHIVPPSELLRMEEEREQQTGGAQWSPLQPPPPLDPDRLGVAEQRRGSTSGVSAASLSYPTSDTELDENATLLTARRVKVQDLGPRGSPEEPLSPSTPVLASPTTPSPPSSPVVDPGPSWAASIGAGLGGLARLSRLSWFRNLEPSSRPGSRPTSQGAARSRSRPSSFVGTGLTDREVEATQALLAAEQGAKLRVRTTLGVDLEGERPLSSISAKSAASGNTVYHSAPGTPLLAPLPRALTPVSQVASHGVAHSSGNSRGHSPVDPPAYDDHISSPAYSPRASAHVPASVDILDIPAPPAVSPFSATMSTSRFSMPFPPGLVPLPTQRSWHEPLSSAMPHARTGLSDALEDEPPVAVGEWSSLAGLSDNGTRRTTFGMPRLVHPNDPTMSEQASMHSMRSPISPYSPHTSRSGSRHNLTGSGSGSSRPSAHSQAHSGESSLVRSQSVSSDGRMRVHSPTSPPNSAFGRVSLSATGTSVSPPPMQTTFMSSPLREEFPGHTDATTTGTTTGTTTDTGTMRTNTTGTTGLEPTSLGDWAMHFPNVP